MDSLPATNSTTPTAARSLDRPEIHNAGVDDELAETGACGQRHLASGRTCTLQHRHRGPCDFVARENVQESVAQHRAAGGW